MKTYLGDSVYIEPEDDGFKLSTNENNAVIYLDSDAVCALGNYLMKLRIEKDLKEIKP